VCSSDLLAIVDLGCGDGSDINALAARCVDPETTLVGVDASAPSVATAEARARADGRIQILHLHLGDRLPFDDATFDVLYTNNLLECLGDADAFVAETARVLRPGGAVVAGHWDWDSQLFDGSDKALVRRLIHAFADWQQDWMDHTDPWMGRRLWGLFGGSGLFQGTTLARSLTETRFAPGFYGYDRAQDLAVLVERGSVSADDYDRFVSEQQTLDSEGAYFYSVTEFVYVGQRAS
jgi:SAM-dependent methyltransferase